MSQKQTPKSCSCGQCKSSKSGSKRVKALMKMHERSFRHKQKINLNQSSGNYDAAPHTERYG